MFADNCRLKNDNFNLQTLHAATFHTWNTVKSAHCCVESLPGVLGEMRTIFPKKGQIHLLFLRWYCRSYNVDKFCPVWLMGSLLKILFEELGYLPFFNTDEHYIAQIRGNLLLFTASWIAVGYRVLGYP